ncbi:unnamed protein product [Lampetra fluviatilis]
MQRVTMPMLSLLCLLGAAMPAVSKPVCHPYPFELALRRERGACLARVHACVGFCESSAFPSKYSVLQASHYRHNITSVAQCCTIRRLEKVRTRVKCGASNHVMEVFTAKECQCDVCRRARY